VNYAKQITAQPNDARSANYDPTPCAEVPSIRDEGARAKLPASSLLSLNSKKKFLKNISLMIIFPIFISPAHSGKIAHKNIPYYEGNGINRSA
jgi:hypothetical protein